MDPREHVVHFHDLKVLAKSPAHYLAHIQAPPSGDVAHYRLGRLVHTIVLGGPPSAVWEGERRGNAWKEFKAANEGREIVTKAEVELATQAANAVMVHPIASQFIVGDRELPVEWRMNGRKVATRGIDTLGDAFICDLKTTSCAEPVKFTRGALRYGYHAQIAMYLEAAASLGRRVNDAYVIAVETAPPFDVTVVQLTPRLIEEGRKLVRSWMERLQVCEESNEWPGYTQSIFKWDVVEQDFELIIDGEAVAA